MKNRADISLWWMILPALLIDRFSKAAARMYLQGKGTVHVIPGIVSFRLTKNKGAAFSLLSDHPMLMIVLTVIVLAAVVFFLLFRREFSGAARGAMWLVLGGGLSNLFDRFLYGSVIDFIKPEFVRFAIFNVADVFVCGGVAVAAAWMIFGKEREHE